MAFIHFIGGFRAVVLTDTIQGTVMILGTIVLLVGVVYHLGGVESAVNKLTEIDPSLISLYGPNEMLDFQFMASFWILVCFGVVGLPHTAVRCMAFKDSKSLTSRHAYWDDCPFSHYVWYALGGRLRSCGCTLI